MADEVLELNQSPEAVVDDILRRSAEVFDAYENPSDQELRDAQAHQPISIFGNLPIVETAPELTPQQLAERDVAIGPQAFNPTVIDITGRLAARRAQDTQNMGLPYAA